MRADSVGLAGAAAVVLAALAACSQQAPVASVRQPDEAVVLAKSEEVAERFQGALKAQLKAALEAGGPMEAVSVCHEAAPAIAQAESERSGAQVSRVSARNRNPQGALSADLAPHYAALERVPMDGGKPVSVVWTSGTGKAATINVLRAIPMQEKPCTVCHGTEVAPALQARIREFYPDDKATGFAPGELRGALLIRWPVTAFAAAKME